MRSHSRIALVLSLGCGNTDAPAPKPAPAILEPREFSLSGGQVTITYACRGCDHVFRVRAHADDQLPKGLRLSDAE